MLFGFCRAVVLGLGDLRKEVAGLRNEVRSLVSKVDDMATGQEQVMADIAALKSTWAGYAAAAAAAQQAALDKARAAWQADDEAAWQAAHSELSNLSTAMANGQPITPPATASNPNPAPVAAPVAPAS